MSESAAKSLTVFAPGSLMGVAPTLARRFVEDFPSESQPSFHFAMTGELADELIAGAGADVAIFADRGYAEQTRLAGRLDQERVLAGNRLCLLVRPDVSPEITGLADLTRPGLTVAIFPPGKDPCGAYSAALLEREGLMPELEAKRACGEFFIAGRAQPFTERFADGTLDAVLVYATIAPRFADIAIALSLPPDQDMHEVIAFTLGTVRPHRDGYSSAAQFVDWLVTGRGQATLREAGFLPPPR